MWFSALSGLSVRDPNLSVFHQDCGQAFFCLVLAVQPLGKCFSGYYLHFRILTAIPFDTVSKQHIIQLHPALFLKAAMLMQLQLRHRNSHLSSQCLSHEHLCNTFKLPLYFSWRTHTKHPLSSRKNADKKTRWVKCKPVAPPQATALWLLVTIVCLCSQALTSGDNSPIWGASAHKRISVCLYGCIRRTKGKLSHVL